jgi:hypothetical protein
MSSATDRHGEAGTALVEFALVLPIFLTLIFGFLEFGRAINYWIDSNHLANEAARWAAVNANPGGSTPLQKWILSQADSDEMRKGGTASVPTPADVCLTFPAGTSYVGDPVRAEVKLSYHWMPFIGKQIKQVASTLVGSSTMRLEVSPTFQPKCSSQL